MKHTHTIEHLPGSTVKITMQIPADMITARRSEALAHLSNTLSIDGFRPGHIPDDVIVAKVGAMSLWTEQLEMVVPSCYHESAVAEGLRVVGRPLMSVTKLVPDNDAEVVAVVTCMPEVTLPDYQEIARTVCSEPMDTQVSDADIEEAITMLRRMRAQEARMKLGGTTDVPRLADIPDSDLPAVDDDFVKALSPDFTSVDDFRTKLAHNIEHEKMHRAIDKRRGMLMEKISEASTVDIPDMLTEYELDRLFAQFEYDISQSGMNADEYFTKIGKTRDEVRAEMQPDAYKRAKTQLVIDAIARAENIAPDESRITSELAEMEQRYQSAPGWNKENARVYVETIIMNQMTIERLEELGGATKHEC